MLVGKLSVLITALLKPPSGLSSTATIPLVVLTAGSVKPVGTGKTLDDTIRTGLGKGALDMMKEYVDKCLIVW